MKRPRAVVPQILDRKAFHQIQLHDDFETASRRGRAAVDVVAAVVRVYRLGPDRFIGSEVLFGEEAVILFVEAGHLVGDVAFVETVKGGLQRLRSRLAGGQSILLGLHHFVPG